MAREGLSGAPLSADQRRSTSCDAMLGTGGACAGWAGSGEGGAGTKCRFGRGLDDDVSLVRGAADSR